METFTKNNEQEKNMLTNLPKYDPDNLLQWLQYDKEY